jgi:hypothetical protein
MGYRDCVDEDVYGRIDPRSNRECFRCPSAALGKRVSSVSRDVSASAVMRPASCIRFASYLTQPKHFYRDRVLLSVRLLINPVAWVVVTPTSPGQLRMVGQAKTLSLAF